jgi:hypothetical protein
MKHAPQDAALLILIHRKHISAVKQTQFNNRMSAGCRLQPPVSQPKCLLSGFGNPAGCASKP